MRLRDRKLCFVFSIIISVMFIPFFLELVSGLKGSTSGLWMLVLPKYEFVIFFATYGTILSSEILYKYIGNYEISGQVRRIHVLFSIAYLLLITLLVVSTIYSFYLEDKAESSNTTSQEMLLLCDSTWAKYDKYVLLALAGNESATPEVLEKLYHKQLANNTNKLTSFRALVDNDFRPLKVRIAGNKNTSKRILEKLGNEDDWYIQKALALNKNTPRSVQEKLWNRDDFSIRSLLKSRGFEE